MTKTRLIWNIFLAFLSGPILAALVLLIPFGMLTGMDVALDLSLAMNEFEPEEDLLVPFVLLAGLISAANIRLAVLMSRDRRAGRVFEATTDRYADDPSGEQNVHGHPGRQFAEEFRAFLAARFGARLTLGEPLGEDYGWGFWIGEEDFSPLWVAVAHSGRPRPGERDEDYILAVTLEPPIMPWRRLTYNPDFRLRDDVERSLFDFLNEKGVRFVTEAEDFVDPEPTTHPPPRF
jgi:hypothetical protein